MPTLLISPILLYVACALGAAGVILAMPKRNVAPFIVGAVLAAAALAAVLVGLGKMAGAANLPNIHFYIFSLIALGSALRVITHQRPIYSALYFILTILSSTGLYLLLQAEFMAFALVIVYAGAILITYMFVIMLATEGPTEQAVEAANVYDRVAREPVVATFAGFILLAVLTTILAGPAGVKTLKPGYSSTGDEIAVMPRRIEGALREAGLVKPDEHVVVEARSAAAAKQNYAFGEFVIENAAGARRTITRDQWPTGDHEPKLTNTEGIGMSLIEGNPGAIEMAGVVLLMAMLGSVVLARRKVEMDETAKRMAAEQVRAAHELGEEAVFVTPAVGGNQ